MEKKPVKRSEYIVELSRDHHAGLLFSWKIREGIKRNVRAGRLLKYVNFFWQGHLDAHFREEEALLFNRSEDPFSRQAKTEHQQLEARLHQLNTANGEEITKFSGFAAALVEHIRFEERHVFPYLETHLSVTVLKSVSKYLKEKHPIPFKDDYSDEFWTDTGDKMAEAGKGQPIHISVKYNGNIHRLITYPNEYRSLMMLIDDRLFMEDFGECRGMGKCGTCLVEIISNPQKLTGFDRNEYTTLLRAGSSTENKRLSCQLIIDEQMDGAELKFTINRNK